MKPRTRERLTLAALFGLVPAVFIFAVLLPSRRRMEARKARMEAISARLKALPAIQPLSVRERALIQDPRAPWRTRIPLLRNDAERFAHYHFVVSDLQGEWKREGVQLLGVRASWDVLNGSYSMPRDLGDPELGLAREGTAAAGQIQGWVLEAGVGGPADQLFQGMAALARIEPLLEPVGLRWESVPQHTRQFLILRNLTLAP
jgi:hypothetical protein